MSETGTDLAALLQAIEAAEGAVRELFPPTPLELSPVLSEQLGCEVLLKCEHLAPTGSFKIRGALNKVRLLTEDQRRRGVVTASTGNHGQGVALAAARAGVAATVYASTEASPAKLAAIRARGAELVLLEADSLAVELEARRVAEASGRVYISPYNDLDVIAGQGTIGLELSRQAEELDAVFVGTGGGGLVSGIGAALRMLSPRTRVAACWPRNSAALLRAMEAGEVVDYEELPTLSDATAGAVEPGAVTIPLARQVVDDTFEVEEADIARALRDLAASDHWIVEGSAALALAGLAVNRERFQGRRVAVILCGRNIALERFLGAIERGVGV
ncbi:threonine/serine dehydratase [Phenylobacterium sp.]|uniref:threonine/serine dehydratase n=1 Tax=Phenylobacterium sp. TaxID=1871053 RepID=UPI0035AF7AFF